MESGRPWRSVLLDAPVAHSISVMVLQARGGRRVLESEPAERA
jgi:hypothetical protein